MQRFPGQLTLRMVMQKLPSFHTTDTLYFLTSYKSNDAPSLFARSGKALRYVKDWVTHGLCTQHMLCPISNDEHVMYCVTNEWTESLGEGSSNEGELCNYMTNTYRNNSTHG